MITVEGKYGIKATILKDSVSPAGVRLVTYEIEYPRIILAEYNTHRMLAKNSSSSRAIPWAKMQDSLVARPVRFGAANPGMQDKGVDHDGRIWSGVGIGEDQVKTYYSAEEAWAEARIAAMKWAQRFFDAGYHKQIGNRLVEPFQMMKTVTSGTEWNNVFWLRNHEAADPTLAELARVMWEAREASTPELLSPGMWHLPYVETMWDGPQGDFIYYILDGEDNVVQLDLETAKKVSAARCAAVSFRNVDYDVEKSTQVFERLVGDDRKHASAFEHQATPMAECEGEEVRNGNMPTIPYTWQEGVSHMDRNGQLWSGPFKGWIQFRKLIPGENKEG